MSETVDYFSPPLGGPTQAEIEAATAVLEANKAAIETQKRGTLVKCTSQIATGKGCGALHEIGKLTYFQTHWYVSPHGCSGGDYWKRGEGQWLCPGCGHRNRLHRSPEIEKMKRYFAEVVDDHDQ